TSSTEIIGSPSSPVGLRRARFVLRASRGCATRSPKGEAWWSQAGSNRRPRHCERRALPAELCPHVAASIDGKRRTMSAIYSTHQGQVKNGEIAVFPRFWPGLPLFAPHGTDIYRTSNPATHL